MGRIASPIRHSAGDYFEHFCIRDRVNRRFIFCNSIRKSSPRVKKKKKKQDRRWERRALILLAGDSYSNRSPENQSPPFSDERTGRRFGFPNQNKRSKARTVHLPFGRRAKSPRRPFQNNQIKKRREPHPSHQNPPAPPPESITRRRAARFERRTQKFSPPQRGKKGTEKGTNPREKNRGKRPRSENEPSVGETSRRPSQTSPLGTEPRNRQILSPAHAEGEGRGARKRRF